VARRGTQHQASNVLGVATPGERRNGAAHRVSDSDEARQAPRLRRRDSIIGTLFETKATGTQALSVAAVVEAEDTKVLGERTIGGAPVDAAGGAETVKEHDGGRAGGAGYVSYRRRAVPAKVNRVIDRRKSHGERIAHSYAILDGCPVDLPTKAAIVKATRREGERSAGTLHRIAWWRTGE
jgi:hypothetical protein